MKIQNSKKKFKSKKGQTVMASKTTAKTRFHVEFIARIQRRTISNFIEQSLLEAIERTQYDGRGVNDILSTIWDIEEHECFVNLALSLPNVLTFEEETLWKLIRGNGYFWDKPPTGSLTMNNKKSIRMQRVKDYWLILLNVCKNSLPSSHLPKFPEKKGRPDQKPNMPDYILAEEGCEAVGIQTEI